MSAEFTQFWCGNDLKEHVILSDEEFFLIDTRMERVASLGKTIKEAKLELKQMGKDCNFLDFCRQE